MISKTTPYFYIIKHIPSGAKYCGQRRKDGCHPTELLTEAGYKTSQKKVKALIDEYGLDSFQIEEIIEFDSGEAVLAYESYFQQQNNCAQDPMWLNGHNGHGLPDWLKANNITNCMQLERVQKKQQLSAMKTNQEKYGVNFTLDIPGARDNAISNMKNTNKERYGVECVLQLPEIISKAISTRYKNLQERYGIQSVMQLDSVKEKQKLAAQQTIKTRYGVINVSQLESTQNKIKENSLAKYGVQHYTQQDEYKAAVKKTNIEKYGVENFSQTEDGRKLASERMKRTKQKEKENPISCPHCGLIGTNRSNMKRWHFDNCKSHTTPNNIIAKS